MYIKSIHSSLRKAFKGRVVFRGRFRFGKGVGKRFWDGESGEGRHGFLWFRRSFGGCKYPPPLQCYQRGKDSIRAGGLADLPAPLAALPDTRADGGGRACDHSGKRRGNSTERAAPSPFPPPFHPSTPSPKIAQPLKCKAFYFTPTRPRHTFQNVNFL